MVLDQARNGSLFFLTISNTLQNLDLRFMCIINERLNRQESNCDSIFKHFETLNSDLHKYEDEMKAEINKAAKKCTAINGFIR